MSSIQPVNSLSFGKEEFNQEIEQLKQNITEAQGRGDKSSVEKFEQVLVKEEAAEEARTATSKGNQAFMAKLVRLTAQVEATEAASGASDRGIIIALVLIAIVLLIPMAALVVGLAALAL